MQDKRFAESIIHTNQKKCFLVHHVQNNSSFGFILCVSGSGTVSADCGLYISGVTYEGGSASCCYIYGAAPSGMKIGYEIKMDGSLGVYVYTETKFGSYRIFKKPVHELSNSIMIDESFKDISTIKQINISR